MTESIEAEKKRLRSLMRGELGRRLQGDLRERAARNAASRLFELPAYRRAGALLSYLPLPLEADTTPVNTRTLLDGKLLCLPRITGPGRLEICPVDPARSIPSQTAPGALGVAEPLGPALSLEDLAGRLSPERGLLVLAPGLAFSLGGGRLGRGGGYYDRLIPRLRAASLGRFGLWVAGFCFDFQVVPALPMDAWDAPVDFVLTGRT
ncbi:MAG: 5-formyltetrahydrofolate cyclo-ligase [Spirochaetaceae bacterium]|jgi:5-formyltetrahydrofolate cyclo-ligase|nr:5-formyltetrahydrofolate cyclo-ligase [Spirochaetaceae bacterium]